MAQPQNINISITTGTLFKIVAVVVALLFVWLIRDILLVVFIAIILASLLEPVVDKLETKRIHRGVAVILLYVFLLVLLILVFRLLIPPIIEQVGLLANNFPGFWQKVTQNFESVREYSFEQGYLDEIQQGLKSLQSSLTNAAGSVYGFVVAIFRNVINLVLILVINFYLVVQRDSLGKSLKLIAPKRYHGYLDDIALRIKAKIGAWARGQLILGLIIGSMAFLGLIFILPRYALVLALVAGLTELIPYLGPTLGAIPAVFLGFTVSFGHGLAVLILYIIIQQLENYLIVPQVMRKQVGLNPVVIIVAMLIGVRLAGLIGIILAVPVATAINIVIRDFWAKSDLATIKEAVDQPADPAPNSND